jgi:hypothetical protein
VWEPFHRNLDTLAVVQVVEVVVFVAVVRIEAVLYQMEVKTFCRQTHEAHPLSEDPDANGLQWLPWLSFYVCDPWCKSCRSEQTSELYDRGCHKWLEARPLQPEGDNQPSGDKII